MAVYGGSVVTENGCNSYFIVAIPKQIIWEFKVNSKEVVCYMPVFDQCSKSPYRSQYSYLPPSLQRKGSIFARPHVPGIFSKITEFLLWRSEENKRSTTRLVSHKLPCSALIPKQVLLWNTCPAIAKLWLEHKVVNFNIQWLKLTTWTTALRLNTDKNMSTFYS